MANRLEELSEMGQLAQKIEWHTANQEFDLTY